MMLSDIFPTGWHCTRLADMQPGDSMVVYGAGPVGLMAAYSAMIQGASKVMIVDRHPDRLRLAEEIGVVPIDDSKGDPVEQILEQTNGKGADKGCECVGYQAHDPQGHEDAAMTMNRLVDSVRFTGHIGVVGIFLPQDQNGPDELERNGKIAFDMGKFWFKGQKIGTGQANVKHYNRQLRDLIHEDRAKPSWIISTNSRSPKPNPATSTSTLATTAGPKSSCIPDTARTERSTTMPMPLQGNQIAIVTADGAGGVEVVDEQAAIDGNLISSRSPDDLPAFCQAIVEQFAKLGAGAS